MSEPVRPTAIGRYQILDILGKGSMGIVYRAHDPLIGRDVAVKVVHIDSDDVEQREASVGRFRREVQAAGRCTHPAIVAVFDFVDQDGDPAIVMEMVEGTSLHRELRDPARRAVLSIPDVLLQMLHALGYAHGLGIIHRDIKPANILLTPTGKVKIADFGIARVADSSSTTHAGMMLGTPSYMAPEQVSGDTIDGRADLFSVGSIFYEMVAGKPPFTGATITETISRLSGSAPADMEPVSAAGGHAYIGVLRQALAKDRTHRFQTAEAFAAALQSASASGDANEQQVTIVLSRRATPAWDPALLQRTERELARFSGPMARRSVQRAATDATSTDELYALLARDLASAADRGLFLRAVGSGRVEPSLGGGRPFETQSARTPPSRAETQSKGPVIPADAIDAARAALVVHVGPIARMLVRDAASLAASGKDFRERLCAHVTRPDELAIFRRRFQSEVEPKLPGHR